MWGGGGEGYGGGRRGRVYTNRYTVTTGMTCIKMGSDESHFNVSLFVRGKVTRPCPQTTALWEGSAWLGSTDKIRVQLNVALRPQRQYM